MTNQDNENSIEKIYNEAMKKLSAIEKKQRETIAFYMKKIEEEKIKILSNKLKQ